jgi:hypothetical protein
MRSVFCAHLSLFTTSYNRPPTHPHPFPHTLSHTHPHFLRQTHTHIHTIACSLHHPVSRTPPSQPHTQLHTRAHTQTLANRLTNVTPVQFRSGPLRVSRAFCQHVNNSGRACAPQHTHHGDDIVAHTFSCTHARRHARTLSRTHTRTHAHTHTRTQ